MTESKRFLLRLDPRLFEALRRWADDDLRSINAQIEYLLTDQARRAGRLPHRRSKPVRPPDAATPDEDEGRIPDRRRSATTAGATPRNVSRR
ncbi:MAG: hypothetical protein ABSG93_19540 [Solirubrobacteraceae bacterium]|jgi:hypothetical protein